MKEAIVHPDGKVEITESPIPSPGPDQVVIKVIYSGSNPKDWKLPKWGNQAHNSGGDVAGTIHAVGSSVYEFKLGDRVAAFHQMKEAHGGFAEYAVAWSHTTFPIPKKTSFEEASTIPLAVMTAAHALYYRLRLPTPWEPTMTPSPLLIYGGSTAVGAFAIKLASLANIHPIISVAGAGAAYVETIIDRTKGDKIIDYRAGDAKLVERLKKALGGKKLEYALDAVSEKGSYQNIVEVLEPNGNLTLVLPPNQREQIPASVNLSQAMVGLVHRAVDPESVEGKAGIKTGMKDFGFMLYRLIGRGLQEGWFSGHPYRIVPGGLYGLESGLQDLKDGKASAFKYIYHIPDTTGVGAV
ncbi:hypothetical protein FOVSG1_013409 [Fusarium oxysporum f. sp. vasinfectum]